MEVKKGYKQTDVGAIPDDWEDIEIGSAIDLLTGFPFSSSGYSRTGIRLLRGSNVKRGVISWSDDDTEYWPAITPEIRKYTLRAGDVVIAMDGSLVGRSFAMLSDRDIPALLLQRVARIRSEVVDQGFLKAWVCSHLFTQHCDAVKTVTAIPHISPADIKSFKIALPPTKSEQESIAEVLSDTDALIESLEQLVAKKRHIKQGAMQDLLTGRKRLPGFDGEWKQISLGELFTFKNGLNKAKKFFGYGTPIVNYMDVFRDSIIYCADLEGRVALTTQEMNNFDVKKGDVLFTRTSETPDEVGMASVVLDEPKQTVFSGFVLRGRPRDRRLCDQFKAYCFRTSYVREQIVAKASYTTRALTNGRLLSAVVLPVPDIEEQVAIASILFDMDNEITALEAKLTKTRQIKHGMMQELLTGRIRLV